MSARYYLVAADQDGEVVFVEPRMFADLGGATAQASQKLGLAGAGTRPHLVAGLEYRFLLDTGSVDADDIEAVRRLVLTDPLLHAIFKLGEQHGYHQGYDGAPRPPDADDPHYQDRLWDGTA